MTLVPCNLVNSLSVGPTLSSTTKSSNLNSSKEFLEEANLNKRFLWMSVISCKFCEEMIISQCLWMLKGERGGWGGGIGLGLMSRSSIKWFGHLNSGPIQTPFDFIVSRSSNGSVSRNDCRPESLAVDNLGKSTCGDCFWYILRSAGLFWCWGKFLILEVLATKSDRSRNSR